MLTAFCLFFSDTLISQADNISLSLTTVKHTLLTFVSVHINLLRVPSFLG